MYRNTAYSAPVASVLPGTRALLEAARAALVAEGRVSTMFTFEGATFMATYSSRGAIVVRRRRKLVAMGVP